MDTQTTIFVIIFATLGPISLCCVVLGCMKTYYVDHGNRLVRRHGDIEMVDFIQPTQPLPTYNHPDLLAEPYAIDGRIYNFTNYYPPYPRQSLPSYHTYDRGNYSGFINSYLEREINPEFILWLITISLLLIIIILLLINLRKLK